MQSLIHNTPKFFENFNFDNNDELGNKMADDWAALFQHDGGSIQMEATYNAFYSYIKMQPKGNEGRVVIEDTATITGYQQQP